MGHYDIRSECNQLRRVSLNTLGIGRTPAIVDFYVTAVRPAQLLKALQERFDPGLELRIVRRCVQEYADAPRRLFTLLRISAERPSRRTSDQRNELAPSHCLPPRLSDRQSIVAVQTRAVKGCPMSVLGQKRTCAVQTACPLYIRKRTLALY